MARLDWLIRRPIAHRGLHGPITGAVENTATAFKAAIAGDYGIETDLQISADSEAMVHHDDALGRLTEGDARLDALPAAAIKAVPFKTGSDRILTLAELCELVDGRATLVLELKSHFDGDTRLAKRVAHVLAGYAGPVAVMSFDPAPIAALVEIAPGITRGMVAERHYRETEWDALPASGKRNLAFFLHAPRSRPQFIAYGVKDLPALPALAAHWLFGLPLLTWTVRSAADRAQASRYADQMIFEGFRP